MELEKVEVTEQEAHVIYHAAFVFSEGAELLLRATQKLRKNEFAGDCRTYIDRAFSHMYEAQKWMGKFNDLIVAQLSKDGKPEVSDFYRREANEIVRTYLRLRNAAADGYQFDDVENGLKKLSDDDEPLVNEGLVTYFTLK